MTVYLDIGAKRIQAYLARTPRLKARRGGSALLEHGSLRDGTRDAWERHARMNDDGKQADGVLSLTLDDPDVADPTVDAVVARTAALLNELAPACEWEIRICRAPSYRDAARRAAEAERAGQALLAGGDYRVVPIPPAPAEVPIVRYCECCQLDPAVRRHQLETGAQPAPMCADCIRRLVEGGARRGRTRREQDDQEWARRLLPGGLRAERELLDGVSERLGRRLELAKEFSDLAALGGGNANHLCTVYADGNRFGALFDALNGSGVSLRDLSAGLAGAMREALVEAAESITRVEDRTLAVVPHLIGGDDLLATVTADRAWAFVIALLGGYHRRAAALAGDLGRQAGVEVEPPTASIGLVFAHLKFPFASCLDLAEEALTRAKQEHSARRSAVCWVDVTEDGPALPAAPRRTAPAVDVLDGGRAIIDALMAIPPSGRAELARVAADPDAVADLAYRLGNADAIRPFLLPDPPVQLADALVLGRWWPCRSPA